MEIPKQAGPAGHSSSRGKPDSAAEAPAGSRASRILPVFVLFLVSGATGLAYEVTWTRMLVRVFGTTSFAVSTVLAAYMAGFALGSYLLGKLIDRKGNPVLVYGLLELGIGVFALVFPYILGGLNPLYRVLYRGLEGSHYSLSLIRFLLCFIVLLIPTTLMGGTLPVLSRFVTRSLSDLTLRVGLLYSINTFGAVAGTFLTGFFVLPALGIRHTTFTVAGLNFAIFLAAYALSRRAEFSRAGDAGRSAEPAIPEVAASGKGERLILFAFLFTGLAALSAEVVWTRVLALVVGTTVYAFSTMLTVFLLGLALGSAVFSRVAQRTSRPRLAFGIVAAAIGFAIFAGTVIFSHLPPYYMDLYNSIGKTWNASIASQFLISLLIMVGPAFLMGGTFPLVARIYATDLAHVGGKIGTAYAYNTVGSIIGSFLGSFFLLDVLGVEKGMLFVSLVYIAVGAVLLAALSERVTLRVRSAIAVAVVAGAVAAAVVGPGWDKKLMTSGVYVYAGIYQDKAGLEDALKFREILFYDEGPGATVSVERSENVLSMKIDGKTDASTGADMINQELTAHIPMLFHPKPDTVLVIGLGSGVSLGSAGRYPVRRLECVELLENVVSAAALFNDFTYDCLDDPRVDMIMGDARNHLLLTDKKYDVIISEPTNVWVSGVGDLFDYEFFSLVRKCLKPDGVACAWFHTYHMGDLELRSGVRTFLEVFPHASLWLANESDLILVATPGPVEIDEDLVARMKQPAVAADLARVGINEPADLLSALLMTEDDLKAYSGSAPIHTDDNMLMEFSSGRRVFEATHGVHLAAIAQRFKPRRFAGLDDATNRTVELHAGAKLLAIEGTLERLGRGAAASLRYYDEAFNAVPGDPFVVLKYVEVHYQLGDAYLLAEDYENAEANYLKVTAAPRTSDTWMAYDGLGLCYLATGAPAPARDAFETAVVLNPYNTMTFLRLGDACLALADTARALFAYDESFRLGSWNFEAANNAAWLRADQGTDLDRALEIALAMTRQSKEPNHFDTLGWVYYKRGDLGRAAGALERAISLGPEAVEPLYHLALVRKAEGRTTEMEDLLRQVIRLDPDGTFGRQAGEMLVR